jgi:linoleoyl-CoA desaturase
MAKVTFNNNGQVFFGSLKKSVDQYFTTNNLKKTGNWQLYSKAAILFPLAFAIYIYLLSASYAPAVGIGLCLVLGFVLA